MNTTMNETGNSSTMIYEGSHLDGMVTMGTTAKIAFLFASFFLIIIGVPGNILVIWTYITVKRLQSLQNVFIINLSVCDTIIIGYVLPLVITTVISEKCPMPGIMCYVNGGIVHICFTASVQTIMHIALVRYVRICCKENTFKDIYTTTNVCVILVMSWFVGVLFLVPLYIMDKKIIFDETLLMCAFDRYNNTIYTVVYKIVCLAFPMSVTVSCYISIYRKIVKTRKQLWKHWNNGLARTKYLHEMAVTKSQFTVFVAYMILYFPFGLTAVFPTSSGDVPRGLHIAGVFLCFTNSCINGIIYGLLNSNIRRAYKDALSFRQRNSVRDDPQFSSVDSNQLVSGSKFITVATMTESQI